MNKKQVIIEAESKIKPIEREHFEKVYTLIRPNFPKTCGKCERVFRNELDYNLNTIANEGHTDVREIDVGYLFFRTHYYESGERRGIPSSDLHELTKNDYPEIFNPISKTNPREDELCKSTMGLILNDCDKTREWVKLIGYIEGRADCEDISISDS